MGEKLEPFIRHGTKEHRVEVSADEILKAIAEGHDIEIRYAAIHGNLDIRRIAWRLDLNQDRRLIISGNVKIQRSRIHNDTDFRHAFFSKDASFRLSTFCGRVYFALAVFVRGADFSFATFTGRRANFRYTDFGVRANFIGVDMYRPASFYGAQFQENTTFVVLWNYILYPLVWLITVSKVKLPRKTVTDFSGFNTTAVMDGASNPHLKRYIDDEQWINSWRRKPKGRWWKQPLFALWELTSHCGRSFGLWLFWSFALAVVFGFLYKGHIDIGSVNNWYTPFYFSVVTFTTLGFGDVTPIDWLGQLWITLEVVCGYLMLGGLISIFANKFARRS